MCKHTLTNKASLGSADNLQESDERSQLGLVEMSQPLLVEVNDLLIQLSEKRQPLLRNVGRHEPAVIPGPAPIDELHITNNLLQLGNICCRTGRNLKFDGKTETIPGDAAANGLLGRQYRAHWATPKGL